MGLCLVGTVPIWRAFTRVEPAPAPATELSFRPPRSAFETALRETRTWRARAWNAVNQHRETVDAWDPALSEPGSPESTASEPWRLRQLAEDPSGHLRRARAAAVRAQALARTPDEQFWAAVQIATLEHETGHHDRELHWAQKLLDRLPGDMESVRILRRAAVCNRRDDLVRQADIAAAALATASGGED